jgi:signal transduction histidine kinase
VTAGAARAVEDRMFRALGVLRVVVLLHAVALNLYRRDNFQHPVAGALVVAVMVAWTGVALWAYADDRRRTPWLLGLDLALAVAALALTPVVKADAFNASVPGFWVMGALLAWAVHWRWTGGLAAAVVLVLADALSRDHLTQGNLGNEFLLLIGGPIVGFLCAELQRSAQSREDAERAAAAARERVRLGRVVHDGVLQVLALVQRGGGELGRLAGEQEAALRSLIRQQDMLASPSADVDLAVSLERLSGGPVQVVTPGQPVPLPGEVVAELVAAVGECLGNVARHVGAAAPAWVLLEVLPDRVVVTVRDEGPGIPAGRLEEAESEGRLGVTGSIRGRLADLGGSAAVRTASFGTEWELVVPVGSAP